MSMFQLERVEFYITNVCNLNCDDCNRFNNFAFKGHERWNEHKDQYENWAKILNLKNTDIIGGEPMSNPDFLLWVEGVSKLWPESKMTIWTNGHYLYRWHELKSLPKKLEKSISLCIAGHHADNVILEVESVENWLGTIKSKTVYYNSEIWQKRYSQSRQPNWPDCHHPEDFWNLPKEIQDECRIIHKIHPYHLFMINFETVYGLSVDYFCNIYFYQPALKFKNNNFYWHDSDPKKAYEVCYFKTCPHFSKGKFYKCGPVATMIDFVDQFDIKVPEHARQLINDYEPACWNWDHERLKDFLDNIKFKHPISNCRLCPETLTTGLPLKSTTQKIKLIRK